MAKAILEFDLNDFDDKMSHMRAVQSLDMASSLWDIEQYFRKEIKYNESLSQEAYDALEKARDEFYRILSEHNIDIDKLLN